MNISIYQSSIDFLTSFKPTYLGKGVVLKCEYKDGNGNLQLDRLNVLFDNELTTVTKVEKKFVDDEEVKQFMSDCKLVM